MLWPLWAGKGYLQLTTKNYYFESKYMTYFPSITIYNNIQYNEYNVISFSMSHLLVDMSPEQSWHNSNIASNSLETT